MTRHIRHRSHKLRTSLLFLGGFFLLVGTGYATYAYLGSLSTPPPPVNVAIDPLEERALALPIELTHAIIRDLNLSPREYLRQADTAEDLLRRAIRAQQESPGTYAGAFIDREGKPHIQYIGVKPTGTGYTTLPTYTASWLTSRQTDLWTWASGLTASTQEAIISISTDYAANRVIIMLLDTPDGHRIALPSTLIDGTRIDFWPLKGAVRSTPVAPDLTIFTELTANSQIPAKSTSLPIAGTTSPVQGVPLCKYGSMSKWTCGHLSATISSTAHGSGFATTACIRSGDEAGPMISGTKLIGMTVGSAFSQGTCNDPGAYQLGGLGTFAR